MSDPIAEFNVSKANDWLVIEQDRPSEFLYPQFPIELAGDGKLHAAVTEGDWLVTGQPRQKTNERLEA